MGQVLNQEFNFQPKVLPEAIEVTTVPEAPKAQESRRKRKQETHNITVEANNADKSPGESSSKRRKHKDLNPNSAHSHVGDNGSKVATLFV